MIRSEELRANATIIAIGPVIPNRDIIDTAATIMARIIGDATRIKSSSPVVELTGENYRIVVRVSGLSASYVSSWSPDLAAQVALDFEAEAIQWNCNIAADITLSSYQRSAANYSER